jgi:membrane-associated phospholipid phosphatase
VYGFEQFAIDPIVDLNLKVRSEITSRLHNRIPIDNFTQYVPAGAVYGLNLLGIKGKHNFLDRSVILGTSAAIVGISVTGIKLLTQIQRPDGTAYNSFPSGHTATAFACAEFLYQEYKDVSVWYGIAGYTVAAGTGFLRMYNNRHWLTDVVAGAGFGILSTKIAYWVFPQIKKLIFKDIQFNFSLIPSFTHSYGLVR